MKSLPLAAKVGGSAIVGGGGITGAGLLINNQIQKSKTITSNSPLLPSQLPKPEEDLDEILKTENGDILKVDPENTTQFTVSGKNVILKIKAVSSSGDKFKGDKWVCKIKGTVEGVEGGPESLSESNFDQESHVTTVKNQLSSNKNNFIDNCKNWRTNDQKQETGWSSDIVVKLTKEDGEERYKFPKDSITNIFTSAFVKSV